jgi:N-acetylmuramoyl-L-alanine amidase
MARAADQGSEPLLPVTSASLPQVVVPGRIDYPAVSDSTDPVDTPDDNDQASGPVPVPVKPTGDLSSLVAQMRASDPGSHELECLAVGVYFEAKSEPLAGQLAVGQVIANRAKSGGRFPSTYCGVLFQRGQFSFVRGHSLPAVPHASGQWQNAVAIAKIVDQQLKSSEAQSALFFHARRVSPGWHLKRVAAIGNHVFYR